MPLVYNSSAYDQVQTLQLLEGIVDIYMPDFKFWDPDVAETTCQAPDYPQVAKAAIKEMHRQVGDLVIGRDGVAQRGLLVRHLVMPSGWAGTAPIMDFIASQISKRTYINIMPQYRPCGEAAALKELATRPQVADIEAAVEAATKAGLTRLDRPRRVFMLRP